VKLTDLDAAFVALAPGGFRELAGIEGAQGVMFQCPKCAADKPHDGQGFVGAHYVLCWFRNPRGAESVADDVDPKPGRWEIAGTGLTDLSFIGPAAASIGLMGGCRWHGFLRNGKATLS